MILHTVQRAKESSAEHIIVATDDTRIAELCEKASIDVQLTDAQHPSGTDRISEVAQVRSWSDQKLIVGLQGDEPATPPAHLDLLAQNLFNENNADMATLCMPIRQSVDYLNKHRVKVVRDIKKSNWNNCAFYTTVAKFMLAWWKPAMLAVWIILMMYRYWKRS